MPDYKPGQEVRFTKGHLGIIDPRVSPYKFADDHVDAGDTGIVVGGDDAPEAPDGWLIVEIEGGPRYVPVHPSMIEAKRFTADEEAALRRDSDTPRRVTDGAAPRPNRTPLKQGP